MIKDGLEKIQSEKKQAYEKEQILKMRGHMA
jgi:hypothetical protein